MPSNESDFDQGRHGLDILFCKMNTIGNVAGDVTQFQLEIEGHCEKPNRRIPATVQLPLFRNPFSSES